MKRRNNDLNVFTYDYISPHPSRWLHNIKIFFKRIKLAYQRVTKGYCDYDLWNFDFFYATIARECLYELSQTTHGHPANITYEKWVDMLAHASELFNNAIDEDNTKPAREVNKLFDEMESYVKETNSVKDEKTGYYHTEYVYIDEKKYNECREKWIDAQKKLYCFREDQKNKACKFLQRHFFNIWD